MRKERSQTDGQALQRATRVLRRLEPVQPQVLETFKDRGVITEEEYLATQGRTGPPVYVGPYVGIESTHSLAPPSGLLLRP